VPNKRQRLSDLWTINASVMMKDNMDFDTLADTIKMRMRSDLTSNEENATILSHLKNDDPSLTSLWLGDHSGVHSYCPEGARDMEWLGYYIAKNTHLEELCFTNVNKFIDSMEPLCRGLKRNKSIARLKICDSDLSEYNIFQVMKPFIVDNPSLIRVEVEGCDMGAEVCRSLALALQGRTIKCAIDDESLRGILSTLRMNPQLVDLELCGSSTGRNGIAALASLSPRSITELRSLDLRNNGIGDEGVKHLTLAIAKNETLQNLDLSHNASITIRGWLAVSALLEAPKSNLQELSLCSNNIDDEGAISFAIALTKNCTLKALDLNSNYSITSKGWVAFSKILCDTSSINSTYFSNHTLASLSGYSDSFRDAFPSGLMSYLDMNRGHSNNNAAAIKIIEHHYHFDMCPLFEWDLKMLPLVIKWIEAASVYRTVFDAGARRRTLSAIYQFIQAMPMKSIKAFKGCS